jgi:hypothetical protein
MINRRANLVRHLESLRKALYGSNVDGCCRNVRSPFLTQGSSHPDAAEEEMFDTRAAWIFTGRLGRPSQESGPERPIVRDGQPDIADSCELRSVIIESLPQRLSIEGQDLGRGHNDASKDSTTAGGSMKV